MPEIPFEPRLKKELLGAIDNRRRRRTSGRSALKAGAAAVTAAVGVGLTVLVALDSGKLPARRNEPVSNIQEEGPLGGGTRVTLHEARRATPYSLAIPPTNEITGVLRGIWMTREGCEGAECSSPQVGFVLATDMRFYVGVSDTTEEAANKEWRRKAAKEDDSALLTVRGHTAIGHQRDENGPSGLTWMEERLSLQFVSPNHTLDELKRFAEAVTYEE